MKPIPVILHSGSGKPYGCHATIISQHLPAMIIESRNAMQASSMLAIDLTRFAIAPISGTFAFDVYFR